MSLGNNVNIRMDIQGLRALAVLSVVVFHLNRDWLPGGFLGVDMFFVISGFLIASILIVQKENEKLSLPLFYFKRIKRILPAYALMLIVVGLVMSVLLIPADFKFFQNSYISALLFKSNQYFATFGDYFSPGGYELPLMHTWSLAVEMQYYLFLPLVIAFFPIPVSRFFVLAALVLLLGGTCYFLYIEQVKQATYFSLLARIPEFFVGVWGAMASFGHDWSKKKQNIIASAGFLMVVASFFLVDEKMMLPGLVALPICLGCVLLIATRDSVWAELFSKSYFVWFGAISYSLYLWHWPILAALKYFYGSYYLEPQAIVVFVVSALSISALSYYFVERRFLVSTLTRSSKVLGLTLLIGCGSLLFFAPVLNSKIEKPLPIEYSRYENRSNICHGKIVGQCLRGAIESDDYYLVIGDSHAAQLNLFFDEVGRANQQAIKVVSASECVTFSGFDVDRIKEKSRDPCKSQIQKVEKLIQGAKTIVIAGKWSRHSLSAEFVSAFERFLASNEMANKKVIVMAQVPLLQINIVRARRFSALGFENSVVLSPAWSEGNENIRNIVEKFNHVEFWDFSKIDLFNGAPYYRGELIYFDKSHINEIGSRLYGRAVASYFKTINE